MKDSSWGRLVGVLVAPGETFRSIAERPTWLPPLLVLTLLGGAVGLVLQMRTDPEEMVRGMTFPESYVFFDAWVVEALRELGVDAWYAPLNDITSSGGKIGGAAQARRGGAVLHHTTVAYEMNIRLMLQVLRIGQEKLSDKGMRSAEKRVGPLRQQTDLPRDVIIEHLVGYFRAHYGLTDGAITDGELALAERLVHERFGTREWIYFLP